MHVFPKNIVAGVFTHTARVMRLMHSVNNQRVKTTDDALIKLISARIKYTATVFSFKRVYKSMSRGTHFICEPYD